MSLSFHKYGSVYQIRVYHSDGDIYTCTTTVLDNTLAWFFSLFDDTYTITHEFMEKYNTYKQEEK